MVYPRRDLLSCSCSGGQYLVSPLSLPLAVPARHAKHSDANKPGSQPTGCSRIASLLIGSAPFEHLQHLPGNLCKWFCLKAAVVSNPPKSSPRNGTLAQSNPRKTLAVSLAEPVCRGLHPMWVQRAVLRMFLCRRSSLISRKFFPTWSFHRASVYGRRRQLFRRYGHGGQTPCRARGRSALVPATARSCKASVLLTRAATIVDTKRTQSAS
jgi:hypothetical protein